MAIDLVLSCGYLAFARQAGFLRAVEEAGLAVQGICGTSSGALAGALWAAGYPAGRIVEETSARRPLAQVRLHPRPWRGVLSMGRVLQRLGELLPARIEDLDLPFGIGVMTRTGERRLLTEGPLPEAVAASCAIPRLFAPVPVAGVALADGGLVDRTFLDPWLAHRGERPVLLHYVETSRLVADPVLVTGVTVVRNRRSGASFLSFGDFAAQVEEARQRTLQALREHGWLPTANASGGTRR